MAQQMELVRELRDEQHNLQRTLVADDMTSWFSPTGDEYERIVDSHIDAWLLRFCGLRVLATGRRSIPSTDGAAAGQEWDARFSVVLQSPWTPPDSDALRGASFMVYGGGSYSVPAATPLRQLSPSKSGQAADAQYFAVLEYTLHPDWTRNWRDDTGRTRKMLPPRLEARLAVCLQRARDAGNDCTSVLDAVALVGVVSPYHCRSSMEALLSSPTCPWPLLRQMYTARRCVFYYCFPASPRPSSVLLPARSPGASTGADTGFVPAGDAAP